MSEIPQEQARITFLRGVINTHGISQVVAEVVVTLNGKEFRFICTSKIGTPEKFDTYKDTQYQAELEAWKKWADKNKPDFSDKEAFDAYNEKYTQWRNGDISFLDVEETPRFKVKLIDWEDEGE